MEDQVNHEGGEDVDMQESCPSKVRPTGRNPVRAIHNFDHQEGSSGASTSSPCPPTSSSSSSLQSSSLPLPSSSSNPSSLSSSSPSPALPASASAGNPSTSTFSSTAASCTSSVVLSCSSSSACSCSILQSNPNCCGGSSCPNKKGSSPMGRKVSPRSSPRTSPLPHRGSSPAHGRSPSPHHFRSPRASPVTAWGTNPVRNKSAFNKVKPSKRGGSLTQVQQGQQLQVAQPQQVQAVQHVQQRPSHQQQRNTKSPVMIQSFPRNLRANSPRMSLDGASMASSTAEELSSATDPSSRRQDPTKRDLEFLMGSRDDEFSDGFGSDNELNFYGEYAWLASRRRPSSSSSGSGAATFQSSSTGKGPGESRPKSCTINNRGTTSPIVPSERNTSSPIAYPVMAPSDHEVSDVSPGETTSGADTGEKESRGRMSNKQRWRVRSSSWDSLRSRRSHQNQNWSLPANSQIIQASQTREQIKLQKKQDFQLQLQHHQQKLELEQRQMQSSAQQSYQPSASVDRVRDMVRHGQHQKQLAGEEESFPVEAINGMSLEEVFKLERMLNAYKSQLLRERVMGNPQSSSSTSSNRDCRTPPKWPASRGATPSSQEFDASIENEFLVQKGLDGDYAPPHPPSRCNSGHCIFDDMDDAILGAMDDCDSCGNFHDDPHQGSRAPAVKMFRSCDRNAPGYMSPSSNYSGTPVSVDGDVDSFFQQNVSNLSRSPGNISFITRAKLSNLQAAVATKISTPPVFHQEQVDQHLQYNLHLPDAVGLDPSKSIDCISSPRSAFSRAKPLVFGGPSDQGFTVIDGSGGSAFSTFQSTSSSSASNRPSSSARPIRVGHPNSNPTARGRSNIIS